MASIQIRDFPDDLHERLRERAAAQGESLSAYLRRELTRLAERPSLREWLAEIETLEPALPGPGGAELVREGRRDAGRE